MSHILFFTGTSSVGKTSLIEEASKDPRFVKVPISAREAMTDLNISDMVKHYNNMSTDRAYATDFQDRVFRIFENTIKQKILDISNKNDDKVYMFERSMLDVAAYSYTYDWILTTSGSPGVVAGGELSGIAFEALLMQKTLLAYNKHAKVFYLPVNPDIPYDNDFGVRPSEFIRNRTDRVLTGLLRVLREMYFVEQGKCQYDAPWRIIESIPGDIQSYLQCVLDEVYA